MLRFPNASKYGAAVQQGVANAVNVQTTKKADALDTSVVNDESLKAFAAKLAQSDISANSDVQSNSGSMQSMYAAQSVGDLRADRAPETTSFYWGDTKKRRKEEKKEVAEEPIDLGKTLQDLMQAIKDGADKLKFAKTSPIEKEHLALRHFTDTVASSGPYVPMWIHNEKEENAGSYSPAFQCISLGKIFQESSPAEQYRILIHEYRHHLQYVSSLSFNSVNPSLTFSKIRSTKRYEEKTYPTQVMEKKHANAQISTWQPWEYDADYFAATHISCPVCLKINQLLIFGDDYSSSKGYFSDKDYEPFIQAAQSNPCCPAHSLIPGDAEHNQIVKQLTEYLHDFQEIMKGTLRSYFFPLNFFKKRIKELDKQSGALLQHIPNYSRDFVRRMIQYKQMQQLLGQKLYKDLDFKAEQSQADQDVSEGKVRLIETSAEQQKRQKEAINPLRQENTILDQVSNLEKNLLKRKKDREREELEDKAYEHQKQNEYEQEDKKAQEKYEQEDKKARKEYWRKTWANYRLAAAMGAGVGAGLGAAGYGEWAARTIIIEKDNLSSELNVNTMWNKIGQKSDGRINQKNYDYEVIDKGPIWIITFTKKQS